MTKTLTTPKQDTDRLEGIFAGVLSLRDAAERQRTLLNGANEKLQQAEQNMIEAMRELGTSSFQDSGGNRAVLSEWLWASPRDEGALFRWLRASGHGDLITRSVNGQSLSAHIRRLRADDAAIPDFIEITTRPRLNVRRA